MAACREHGRTIALIVTVAGLVLFPCAAPAQRRASRTNAAASDSALWQRVMDYAAIALEPQIRMATGDTARLPWILRIHANKRVRSRLESQLTTMLHARPVTRGDRSFHALDLGPVRVANDTAYVHFAAGGTVRGAESSQDQTWARTSEVPFARAADGSWGPGLVYSGIARDNYY
jgi:hypothetical protein